MALIAVIVVTGFLIDQETFEACILAAGYMTAAVSFLNFAAIFFFGEKMYDKSCCAAVFRSTTPTFGILQLFFVFSTATRG